MEKIDKVERYLFISYSHADMNIAQSVIRALQRRNFRIWYDDEGKGIPPGTSWLDYIDEKLKKAGKTIFFLSRDSIKRPQVIRELKMMLKQKKEIITVMLEEVPFSRIEDEEIREYFNRVQVMKLRTYGGLNSGFLKALMNLIGMEYCKRPAGEEVTFEEVPVLERMEEQEKSYIYEDGFPVKAHYKNETMEYDFYKLTPGDTSPMMVFPAAMDDQWHPDYMYRKKGFAGKYKLSPEIAAIRYPYQRDEVMLSLLHYPQVLLNRAFLLNAPFIYDCYWKDSSRYSEGENEAFTNLINKGVICTYLMTEKHPAEIPRFEVDECVAAAWNEFCQKENVHCLRFDWDEQTNLTECRRRLFAPFYEFCVTLCDEPYRIESLMNALEIPEEKKQQFKKRLIQVRNRVMKEGQKEDGSFNFSRSQFYQAFVIKKDTKVAEGIFDKRKPFALELKQMIDLKYNCNLADGCQCILKEPKHSLLRAALAENQTGNSIYRQELKVDDLSYAISEFSPELDGNRVRLPMTEYLTFELVNDIRTNSSYWKEYMEHVERMTRRANQWMIDFNSMGKCVEFFKLFAGEMEQKLPEASCRETDDAVSIIFQIDNQRISIVYNETKKQRYFHVNDKQARRGLSPLSIYFSFGDVLEEDTADTICSEILFYQGRTDINGDDFSKKIIKILKEEGFKESGNDRTENSKDRI